MYAAQTCVRAINEGISEMADIFYRVSTGVLRARAAYSHYEVVKNRTFITMFDKRLIFRGNFMWQKGGGSSKISIRRSLWYVRFHLPFLSKETLDILDASSSS